MFRTFIYNSNITYIKRGFCERRTVLNVIKKGDVGEKVSVQGWVKSLRKQKDLTFYDINDGSTVKNLQIIVQDKSHGKINVGSSVRADGILQKSPKGQNEVNAENLVLIGGCDLNEGYPFAPRKKYAPEYVREYLHLRPQTRRFGSLLRVRHGATVAFHKYLDQIGYVCIQTPIITSNDCEGAGEVFKVVPDNVDLLKSMVKENVPLENGFFDKKSFLTVSGQLHLEAAAHALQKVYCLGPTFRAENSKTRFHLAEFYMLEIEKGFLENLSELLQTTEDIIKKVTVSLLDTYMDDINVCANENMDFSWIDKPFNIITFTEAVDILNTKLNKPTSSKGGLLKEHELLLTEYFNNRPVFVINWPKDEKPFYMKEIDDSNVSIW
ncbi:asparagine--tRNA ligase, mitochondrial isoform X2 [Rhynchophorus ferrugineus]|uniref:asparagine--tRNA ligase, mitochondrial isoform X2 n=1 Tax=Rhynchophorus ferrugineus TaxID=354439 RepID=UPI003FCCA62C